MKKLRPPISIATSIIFLTHLVTYAQAGEGRRAETIIPSVTVSEVKSAIVNQIADSEFKLTRSSEFILTAERKLTDIGSVIWLSNPGGGLADLRATYTIADVPQGGVRVVVDLSKVTHSVITDYNFDANDSPEMQNMQAQLDIVYAQLTKPKTMKRTNSSRGIR